MKSGIADDPAIKAEVANAQSSILAGAHLNHVASKATSDSELLRRYEEMKKSGVKSVRARHILVKTSEEAEDLITQLQNGADFGELAKAYSVGPSGPSGGDLGFFGPGQMVKPFQDAAFSLEKEPTQFLLSKHVLASMLLKSRIYAQNPLHPSNKQNSSLCRKREPRP